MKPTIFVMCMGMLVPAFLAASEAPLGGIGYRYDGSGYYADCKPPVSADPATGEGVRWKIPTANWGFSQPVEIADQVLLMCEPGAEDVVWPTLVSYDVRTGEERWRTAIDPLLPHQLPTAQHERLTEQWALVNEHYRFLYKNAAQFATANESERAAINAELGKRNCEITGYKYGYGLLRKLKNDYAPFKEALAALKPYGPRITTWQNFGFARVGVTFTSPVTDGEHILVQTLYGTVACLDMAGKIRWIKDSGTRQLGNKGQASSPRIVGDLGLSCQNGLVVAWDLKTGAERWRHGDAGKITGHGYIGSGAVMEVDGEAVLIDQAHRVLRVRDGKLIHGQLGSPKYSSVCVDDAGDRFFLSFGKGEKSVSWNGYQVVSQNGELAVKALWNHAPGLGYVSPAFFDGFIYHSGTVLDPATGLVARGGDAQKRKPGEMPRMRGNGGPGSKHLILIADGRVYGMQQEAIKDKSKKKTGPFFAQLQVYSAASKKLGEIRIPFATKEEPAGYKAWEQGILNEKANVDYVWNYAFAFTLGKDCIYVRNPAYLYCFGN